MRVIAPGVVILVLLLAACGGDDSGGSSSWTSETQAARQADCVGADKSATIGDECRCLIEHLRADLGDDEALAKTANIGDAGWAALFTPYGSVCAR